MIIPPAHTSLLRPLARSTRRHAEQCLPGVGAPGWRDSHQQNFRRDLDVQSRFHKYNWGNVASFRPREPTPRVAGYGTWPVLHRYVKSGEHGIKTIVPMRRRVRSEEPGDTEEDRLFFGFGTVFDISQTDGEPLRKIDVQVLIGDNGGLYARLVAHAQTLCLMVQVVEPRAQGARDGNLVPATREIGLRQLFPAQMAKTLTRSRRPPKAAPQRRLMTVV